MELTDALLKKFNSSGLALHVLESALIGIVWSTSSILLPKVPIIPYDFSAGDCRVILVDFDIDQEIESRVIICTLVIRRLVCSN